MPSRIVRWQRMLPVLRPSPPTRGYGIKVFKQGCASSLFKFSPNSSRTLNGSSPCGPGRQITATIRTNNADQLTRLQGMLVILNEKEKQNSPLLFRCKRLLDLCKSAYNECYRTKKKKKKKKKNLFSPPLPSSLPTQITFCKQSEEPSCRSC